MLIAETLKVAVKNENDKSSSLTVWKYKVEFISSLKYLNLKDSFASLLMGLIWCALNIVNNYYI